MTFKQLIERLRVLGVDDSDVINYVDVHVMTDDEIFVRRKPDNTVDVVDFDPNR